jgi:hypothetical protein
MRLTAPLLVLGALCAATPAVACVQQEVNPCARQPVTRPLLGTPVPADPATGPVAVPTPPRDVEEPTPLAGNPVAEPPAARPHPGGEPEHPRIAPVDPRTPEEIRGALRLGVGRYDRGLRTGPAGSLMVPTALGVSAREAFVGVGYQARTRYTRVSDGGAVVGIGAGDPRTLAAEFALSSFSTVRSVPFETGGISVKLHRQLRERLHLAGGVETLVAWGNSDAQRSLYLSGTRLLVLRDDPRAPLSAGVLTLGAGNGRFRRERDDAAGRETVNLFAAAGLRVVEPVSVVVDWTGQDLAAGVSATPLRRVPLVVTVGGVDLTGSAGDGARLILSIGYGIAVPWRS